MRYLGVDPGRKRVGLAVGDDLTSIAMPLEVCQTGSTEQTVELILRAAERHGAQVVVLGFPTREDGSPSGACARSVAIEAGLVEGGAVVARQGEFLSSDEARRRAREAGLAAKSPVDHFAAQVLLEEYLASHRTEAGP